MKKTIICNIPMREFKEKTVYMLESYSCNALPKGRYYPVNAFIEQSREQYTDVKIILIKKIQDACISDENVKIFEQEFLEVFGCNALNYSIEIVESPFSEDRKTHELLMKDIVNKIDVKSSITADITFGPKDLAIIDFTALNFAENQLSCDIDHIIYGQGLNVKESVAESAKICDLASLYYLNSLVTTIKCNDSESAKSLLSSIIDK